MRYCNTMLVLFGLLVCLMVGSCQQKEGAHTYSADEKRLIDSTIESQQDTTALKQLLTTYKQEDNVLGAVRTMRKLGRIYRNASLFKQSLAMHSEEYMAAKSLNDTIEIVQSLNNIGTVFRRISSLEQASKYHFRALEYCLASTDTSSVMQKNTVVSLNGLGNVYLSVNNYRLARDCFQRALDGETKLGSLLGQAINYANIGSILQKLGNTDSAWLYYRRSMECNMQLDNQTGISLCHTYYGGLYEEAGKYDKAIEEYEIAYLMMSESTDRWHYLESCIALARANLKSKVTGTAIEFLKEAKMTAEEIGSPEHLVQIYELYYQIYLKEGNYRQALASYIDHKRWGDSIANINKLNEIENQHIAFVHKRNQTRMSKVEESLENERKNRTQSTLIFFIVMIVLLSLIVFFFLLLQVRIRHQAELKELQETRERFFTNITHEFRTPLTIIQAAGENIAKNRKEPDTQDDVRNIMNASKNLLALINQLLDIAKLNSGKALEPQWRHDDVVGFLRNIAESYMYLARKRGISIRIATKHNRIDMDFVPDYMRKIFNNLLSNSIKFGYPDTELLISIAIIKGKVRLEVKDEGLGMTPTQLQHAFEPFYQAEGDSTHIGTGVGLSVTRMAVEAMQGSIKAYSRYKETTTFVIVLPMKYGNKEWPSLAEVPEQVSAEQRPEKDLAPQDSDATDEEKTRILIVEDSMEVALYEADQLKGDYLIFYATNGKEGLEKATALVPDMIITDVMMPVMDGYELCKAVREHPLLNHIPVIMVTAKVTREDRLHGLELGVDAYIEKPFNADELNAQVKQLLEQRRMLLDKFGPSADGAPQENGAEDDKAFVKQFETIVDNLMAEHTAIDLNTIATQMGVNRTQLNRKMKAITGMTSTSYLQALRMSTAKLLLTTTELSVAEVAAQCGITDVAYFSQLFKKATGKTPKQFRDGWTRLK